jgi:hypothetical protein
MQFILFKSRDLLKFRLFPRASFSRRVGMSYLVAFHDEIKCFIGNEMEPVKYSDSCQKNWNLLNSVWPQRMAKFSSLFINYLFYIKFTFYEVKSIGYRIKNIKIRLYLNFVSLVHFWFCFSQSSRANCFSIEHFWTYHVHKHHYFRHLKMKHMKFWWFNQKTK